MMGIRHNHTVGPAGAQWGGCHQIGLHYVGPEPPVSGQRIEPRDYLGLNGERYPLDIPIRCTACFSLLAIKLSDFELLADA